MAVAKAQYVTSEIASPAYLLKHQAVSRVRCEGYYHVLGQGNAMLVLRPWKSKQAIVMVRGMSMGTVS